jgi:hypothetical protein
LPSDVVPSKKLTVPLGAWSPPETWAENATKVPEATFDAELPTITEVDDGAPGPPHPETKPKTTKAIRRAVRDLRRRAANPTKQRPTKHQVAARAGRCSVLLLACAVNGPSIESVKVDDPAASGTVAGEKVQVVPAGNPLAQLRETGAVNPRTGVNVSVSVVVPPADIASVDGLGLTVKSGFETMMVSGALVTLLKS